MQYLSIIHFMVVISTGHCWMMIIIDDIGWTFSKKDGDFEHKKNLIKKSLPWDSINRIFSGSCK